MVFFALCRATFLVWFSIPTAGIYIIGYYLISKDKLGIYVRMVYAWLTLYMSITTICLGYRFGFHLYTMSMIPIVFYTEYMAFRLKTNSINTTVFCVFVVSAYLLSTGYSAYMSPIYDVDSRIAGAFWLFNSMVVLGFVTFYSGFLIRTIIDSEKQLSERANRDRLTHLYNRHYMMEKLKEAYNDDNAYYIAMLDVDNFKSINDKYGHLAGDEVLKRVARAMEDVCSDSLVSRWGGEEFLILTEEGAGQIERLRRAVEDMIIEFEGREIRVTFTAGVELKNKDIAFNKWIVAADEKLYAGKHNGKNRVVS
jgi:diguanylate cyclase (GGDEF)-like protein